MSGFGELLAGRHNTGPGGYPAAGGWVSGEIAELLRRSTVQVLPQDGRGGTGSGIVWNAAGLIVTNAHVARSSDAQVELWDGRRFPATVTMRDPRRDLAALRIEGATNLVPIEPGDSDKVRAGELVIAIGNPLGFTGALSSGVVHSTGALAGMGRQNWIRADVRLAPGNSGGPLANAQGQAIGINTAIVHGLGVAVPSNAAAEFVRRGARPSLGVVLETVRLGLLIRDLDPAGAAAAASLRQGDVLLGSFDDLSDSLDSGSEVLRLRFLRDGRAQVREAYVRLRAAEAGGVIRVLIAAPSTVVRAGLEALVASSPGLEVAGVYPDLAALDSLRPDVVLSTLLPQDELTPPTVLLSSESQPAWTPELLRLGVRAVLPRDASAAEILAAVEAAAAGFAAVDPRELETMMGSLGPVAAAAAQAVLTGREMEVLGMLAEGSANKTIAWKLGISEHTVKFHVASILAKLGASSRTEAVTLGIRRGIVLL